MSTGLDTQTLDAVFQSRPDILEGIRKAADNPARVLLFNNIASFVHDQLSSTGGDEHATKRRRVDISSVNGHASSQANGSEGGVDAAATDPVLLEIKDISLSVPQRKKYDLCFTKNFLYARAAGTSVPVQGIVYPWKAIEHAFYVPVPEKSQVQYNYVLFPRNSYLPGRTPTPTDPEPLVFTVPATAPKPGSVNGTLATAAAAVSDTYSSLFNWALTTHMRSGGNKTTQIVSSDAKLFHSAARNAYRPNEKAVHIKAFRGSKDGFLFFLSTGILWAFKKPLMFLPLDKITAVSYTNVLQRTFNMVVELEAGADGKVEELEFAMIDQEDYQGINGTYVSRHGLADRSMAEQRKAKRELAENAKKTAGADGEADGAEDDGMTELERAQIQVEQELQDDEDEEEEDYDPGSEGESEGSGESSDEDDDDDDDDDDDGPGGEDDDQEMEE